jgi:hypothetical protein
VARPVRAGRASTAKKDVNMTTITVYVELLDEGVQVWQPTEAEVLGEGRYRLIARSDYDEGLETWAFVQGTVVRCEDLDLGDGLVPVAVEVDEGPSA